MRRSGLGNRSTLGGVGEDQKMNKQTGGSVGCRQSSDVMRWDAIYNVRLSRGDKRDHKRGTLPTTWVGNDLIVDGHKGKGKRGEAARMGLVGGGVLHRAALESVFASAG
ncbi:uncharacterized protein SPSK_00941 [Sporothrix schenckii 1099-18]|uniref:Uncharacterized protein n=1 Tax=Sporothrix schenckii 1099-18 TaxID=1397361 RepID=A0A0F2LWJ7_SPOSC|nr:uncharacterized protein SPSK_00941 [Sporothrix schenckii 1099-18]KJR81847.1 hypothetical protein SPSK_00941 [Sporothrix schenckii 1099-18]